MFSQGELQIVKWGLRQTLKSNIKVRGASSMALLWGWVGVPGVTAEPTLSDTSREFWVQSPCDDLGDLQRRMQCHLHLQVHFGGRSTSFLILVELFLFFFSLQIFCYIWNYIKIKSYKNHKSYSAYLQMPPNWHQCNYPRIQAMEIISWRRNSGEIGNIAKRKRTFQELCK